MPGEISRSNPGPRDDAPYVPSWCYEPPGPKECRCGHHEGFHNDAGQCLHAHHFSKCGCAGFAEKDHTAMTLGELLKLNDDDLMAMFEQQTIKGAERTALRNELLRRLKSRKD